MAGEIDLYYAGDAGKECAEFLKDKKTNRLFTFYSEQKSLIEHKGVAPKLFLDSGAYSAFTKGVSIDIDAYARFVHEHKDALSLYANLDNITDPQKTMENQKYLESLGLHPLATFHVGEPLEILQYYCEHYDYVALGGMVPYTRQKPVLEAWLITVWKIIKEIRPADNKRGTDLKVHGFGLTTFDLVEKYPFHSVDSTSWVMTGRYGNIFTPWGNICISNEGNVGDKKHFRNLPKFKKDKVTAQIQKFGFTEEELADIYQKRDEYNILYLLEWAKNYEYKPVQVFMDTLPGF